MPSTTYFTLSPPPNKSSCRYPLTPPCVSPPTLSTYSSRPEIHRSHTSPKASTLLSKVALRSPLSRRNSPSGTPPQERVEKVVEYREKDQANVMEELRFWQGTQQREGYISFPDFERYRQQYEEEQEQLEQAQQTMKT